MCPKGTWSDAVGSAAPEALACTACPSGRSTLLPGSTSEADCIQTALQCPQGTQAPSAEPVASFSECLPLVCQPPLMLSVSRSSCVGCPSGQMGVPGACMNCNFSSSGSTAAGSGVICSGLLSVPLVDLSSSFLALRSAVQDMSLAGSASATSRVTSVSGSSNSNGSIASAASSSLSLQLTAALVRSLKATGSAAQGAAVNISPALLLIVAVGAILAGLLLLLYVAASGSDVCCGHFDPSSCRKRQTSNSKEAITGASSGNSSSSSGSNSNIDCTHSRLTGFFLLLDLFSLRHPVPTGGSPVKRPTALGGFCSSLGILVLAVLAAVLAQRREEDNVLLQQSVLALPDDLLQRLQMQGAQWTVPSTGAVQAVATVLGSSGSGSGSSSESSGAAVTAAAAGWSQSLLQALLPQAGGLQISLLVSGEPGLCSRPLTWQATGMGQQEEGFGNGTWQLLPVQQGLEQPAAAFLPHSSAAGTAATAVAATSFSLQQYVCRSCSFTKASQIIVNLHYSCQSMFVTAAAVGGDGRLSFLALPPASSSGSDSGGLLSTLQWQLSPLLTVVTDVNLQRSMGYALFQRGSSSSWSSVPAASVTSGATVLPLAASLRLQMLLPLQDYYENIVMSEKTSVLQLLTSIVGLSGLLAVFGAGFQGALWLQDCKKKGAFGSGSEAGSGKEEKKTAAAVVGARAAGPSTGHAAGSGSNSSRSRKSSVSDTIAIASAIDGKEISLVPLPLKHSQRLQTWPSANQNGSNTDNSGRSAVPSPSVINADGGAAGLLFAHVNPLHPSSTAATASSQHSSLSTAGPAVAEQSPVLDEERFSQRPSRIRT